VIASLTLTMLWFEEGQREIGNWKFVLPPLMLFLSGMMFSHVKYPSFKAINWRTQRSLPKFLAIIILLVMTALNWEWMPAVLFVSFLIYGFVRPFASLRFRRSIEDDEETAGPGDHAA
jgi:CDP-diacylglycerol--serine O-phosphatidyltransferase